MQKNSPQNTSKSDTKLTRTLRSIIEDYKSSYIAEFPDDINLEEQDFICIQLYIA